MHKYLKYLISLIFATATLSSLASVTIKDAGGWLETAWVEWTYSGSGNTFAVYVSSEDEESWVKLDYELMRDYGSYGRADALGLKAGDYRMKVVPVKSDGTELTDEAATTPVLEVRAHNRQGFAHFNRPTSGLYEGVGAYKNDGTLKDDAIVIYITNKNSKTLTVTWPYTSADKTKTYTGLQTILDGFRKCNYAGGLRRPLCIRIIGTITKSDLDNSLSSQGLAVKAEQPYTEHPLTIEGVGNDATIYGFGMQVSNCCGTEIRNLAIMLDTDDGIEVASDNCNVWIHNMDMFYGQTGKDADQVKGDGAIDTKLSRRCTISANHFFDCGKCCLIDANKTKKENYADSLTYCGNWFDHADQRLPRCRHGEAFHVYNNYYDGNGLYGIGLASKAAVFAENNYFRNCKYPVIASAQGTDKNLVIAKQSKKGLLSGEDTGICKFYNNHIEGATSFITQNDNSATLFDAYVVTSRNEQIPSTVTGLTGGATYSNFDTGDFYPCTPLDTELVPEAVTGQYGAGRCQKGDFSWTFDNSVDDASCDLNAPLKAALQAYKSSWIGFFDGSDFSEVDAIQGATDVVEDPAFDLQGRKVGIGYKGIVIKDGKKILVK